MAIIEMKKMRLVALKRDRAKLLHQLQKLARVQVVRDEAEEMRAFAPADASRLDELLKLVARLDWAIAKLKPFDQSKGGFLAPKPLRNADTAAQALASREDVLGSVKRLEEIERTLGELRGREAKENAQIAQLSAWEGLNIPLDEIRDTSNALVRLLAIPIKAHPAFVLALEEFQVPAELREMSRDRENVYALFICHRADGQAFEEAAKRSGATEAAFAGVQGTPALAIDQLRSRLERIREVRTQLNRETEGLAARMEEIKTLRDVLFIEQKQAEAAAHFAETDSSFLLTGWAPAGSEETIKRAVSRVTDSYSIDFSDPAEDDKPPTLLKNRGIVRSFEMIVNLYSTPDPRGIDPTFVMMPFYACFFGLMVSDAAYGIILGILTGLVAYRLRGRGGVGAIAAVLGVGAVATVLWGGMLGGWFGIEDIRPWIGFTPMSDPLKMMVLCLGLGGFHIVFGMLVAAYMRIRRGQYWAALFDQGFWLILFSGIGLLFVNQAMGYALMGASALGIVLTAGREKKNFFGKLTSGLGALYNIAGYVSDLLSYARLFGMGLATGVIAMVFNKVAMMIWGGAFGTAFAIVILVVGHLFNLAINTLGAYVHACRLQYIEFFGKFYEDGGTLFRPLEATGKYMDFADNPATTE